MNLFLLHEDPKICAQYHADMHVNKMIVETAQMLSTNHRILDGYPVIEQRVNEKTGRKYKVKTYKLDNELDSILYKSCHINHPCTVWLRESIHNYNWGYDLMCELGIEVRIRYGTRHKTISKLREVLKNPPNNIPNIPKTPFKPAITDKDCMYHEGKLLKPVEMYRKFYMVSKTAKKKWDGWKHTPTPDWFQRGEFLL